MELAPMTNMMINLELAEQKQADLAARAISRCNQKPEWVVRPSLIHAIWKRLPSQRRTRVVQPVVSRLIHG
jgi:hypothetical protein